MEVQQERARQSLWRLIEEQVPHPERPEVRTVLGQALVDMYTEAHSEVDMWLGIWREIKQGFNCGFNRRETPRPSLADPPVVKELLRGEVRMLLQSIRERACREGRDGEEVWSRYDPDTVSYALGRSTDTSRCIPGSSTQPQPGSSLGDELEAVRDKLNVVHIDRVVAHLRCVLTEDCEALKRQVLWVQDDIEKEYRSQLKNREPTFTELREQRRVIQMDLDLPSPLLRQPHSSSSSSPSVSSPPPSSQSLKNTSRSSAGLGTPHPRFGTPDLRPRSPDLRLRPLSSLPHAKPSPPPGSPPTRPCSASLLRPPKGSPGVLPHPSEAALRPAASSTQRGTRRQITHSSLSVDQRNNAKGVENNVSSVSDKTHGDERERNTDLNVLSMTDGEAQNGTRRDITNGFLCNTMNQYLRSVTEDSHTHNDDDNRRSIVGSVACPISANRGQTSSAVFLTAPFQPLPPTVPKRTTGERHLVRRLSVKQDYNLLQGLKGALHTVNI